MAMNIVAIILAVVCVAAGEPAGGHKDLAMMNNKVN